ncbi:MAG: hypothetical protein WC489_00230 [Patescibacteria group bacterium]
MKSNFGRLKHRLNEVYNVEPNDLGLPFLTLWYRRVNKYFKRMPFRIVVPASLLGALLLYLIFGYMVVRLASILQYGF